MMIVAGFGWAKPVPVNPNYFKKPKQGMAITALAGPVSNFVLALLLLLAARLVYLRALATGTLPETLFTFLVNTASLSVGLGLFNLVPVPPLDGSKVVAVLLPDRAYNWLMRYEQFGMRAAGNHHLRRHRQQCAGRGHPLGVRSILPHRRLLRSKTVGRSDL